MTIETREQFEEAAIYMADLEAPLARDSGFPLRAPMELPKEMRREFRAIKRQMHDYYRSPQWATAQQANEPAAEQGAQDMTTARKNTDLTLDGVDGYSEPGGGTTACESEPAADATGFRAWWVAWCDNLPPDFFDDAKPHTVALEMAELAWNAVQAEQRAKVEAEPAGCGACVANEVAILGYRAEIERLEGVLGEVQEYLPKVGDDSAKFVRSNCGLAFYRVDLDERPAILLATQIINRALAPEVPHSSQTPTQEDETGEAELVKKLPLFVHKPGGDPLTEKELMRLAEIVRDTHTPTPQPDYEGACVRDAQLRRMQAEIDALQGTTGGKEN